MASWRLPRCRCWRAGAASVWRVGVVMSSRPEYHARERTLGWSTHHSMTRTWMPSYRASSVREGLPIATERSGAPRLGCSWTRVSRSSTKVCPSISRKWRVTMQGFRTPHCSAICLRAADSAGAGGGLGPGAWANRWEYKEDYVTDLISYVLRPLPWTVIYREQCEAVGSARYSEMPLESLLTSLLEEQLRLQLSEPSIVLAYALTTALPNHPLVRAQMRSCTTLWSKKCDYFWSRLATDTRFVHLPVEAGETLQCCWTPSRKAAS